MHVFTREDVTCDVAELCQGFAGLYWGPKASSLEHNSEWRQAAEGGELFLMVGSFVGEASHWLHVPFV